MMQQKVDVTVEEEPELPSTITSYQRREMFKTTYSTNFLHLTNNVLRQVNNCTTTVAIWKKLDELLLGKIFT